MMTSRSAFNFDEWVDLAQSDPDAFERAREEVLRDAIARAPNSYRGRLSSLQWRVDRERERADTPFSACLKISNMMMNRVYGKEGLLELLAGDVYRKTPNRHSDNILKFPRPS